MEPWILGEPVTEHIELLRRGYTAWNSGDLDELVSLCHHDITIHPMIGAVVAAGEYHGRDGARRLFEDSRKPWHEFRIDAENFVEAGDKVIIFVHVRIRSKEDTFTIDGHVAHVAEFRDGLVVALEGFRDHDQALASVNL